MKTVFLKKGTFAKPYTGLTILPTSTATLLYLLRSTMGGADIMIFFVAPFTIAGFFLGMIFLSPDDASTPIACLAGAAGAILGALIDVLILRPIRHANHCCVVSEFYKVQPSQNLPK
jgi:hypothetical protein